MEDLSSKVFGKLTVIKRDSGHIKNTSDAHSYWLCKCSCGKIISTRGSSLKAGKATSCGCSKSVDITNQTFGDLTALYPTDKRSGTHIKWHCICKCGKELDIDGHSLRAGLSKSCGCNKKSRGEERIETLLKENNISYEKEKIFSNFKYADSGFCPRFDFYIENQYLIEFDGKQHFEQCFNIPLKEVQTKDEIKNQWCEENNIPLIRIPYWHLKELCIEDLLLKTSNFVVLNDDNISFKEKYQCINKEKKIMLKENSRKVFDYVKSINGANVTAADIAEATGLEVKSVNGIVTSAFQRKGLMERIPAEIELEDGTHKPVKFIKLTAEGEAFDPDAPEEKAE